VHGTAGAEDCDDGARKGRGDMSGAAVVANENATARDKRDELAQIERVEKDEVASALASHFGGNLGFTAPEIENRLDSMVVAQFPPKGNKFVDGPTLGEIFRAGMQHGVRSTRYNATRGELLRDHHLRIALGIYMRGRNRTARQSGGVELLHAMLDSMYTVSGIGNENVVNERELAMGPADALRHSDGRDQQGARWASVLIVDDGKMTTAELGGGGEKSFRQQDFGNGRIAFEQWRAERLDEDAQTQIRPPGVERGKRGGQQDDISERAKADD